MNNPPHDMSLSIREKSFRPRPQRAGRGFYFAMSLVIAAIVACGFGPTLDAKLLHPARPLPLILYVHAMLFTAWVLVFIAQTALVRTSRTQWHREFGVVGVVIGAAMPFVGVATALAVARLATHDGGDTQREASLVISLFDMLAFGATFWLAVWYRKRPEYHRRFMLMASCGLTAAAFARFPNGLIPTEAFYLGVDALMLAGVARDLLAERRIHPVYLFGLPPLVVGQAAAMWVYLTRANGWLAVARGLLQAKWSPGVWTPAALVLLLLPITPANSAHSSSARQAWIASWAASPVAADPDPKEPLLQMEDQTVRQRVRLSIGGPRMRVRLSNEHGANALTVGSATVALASDAASVTTGSVKSLTFAGRSSVTIPAGAPILSDPVDLEVAPGAEVSISLYLPKHVSTPTLHSSALKRAVVSPRGDFTRADRVDTQAVSESSMFLGAVLVPARRGQQLVVAFGDSITDGIGSTVDADGGWPSNLARRFTMRKRGPEVAVVNAGIAGNRLLSDGPGIKALGLSGLARFERDALSLPGVTHVVLLEGINDLGFPGATLGGQLLAEPTDTRTAEDVIGAYRQLIARAHARGVKVIGATLTPFEGTRVPGYYSAEKEAERQKVNAWIRSSGEFDGVIDFDAVLRDPTRPSRLDARYASRDNLHPTDAGYRAMAEAIDLTLFQ